MKLVLIADDEPHLRLLVSATIESDEYEVVEAEDGDQAWEIIHERHPDVAILDVQMPGRSGLDIARSVRADPALAGTHLIMLTSKAQQSDIANGLAAGADLYLTKPFMPLELLTAVERALGVA
jgi:DNA-binding response OmpR family regulator